MSVLTALLTRDRVVSPRKIDEAIQRQVISGGDFETNLLEVAAIGEDTLSAYCAAAQEHRAATRDEVLEADPVVIARLPREQAERHQVVPLRVEADRLVVVRARALEPGSKAVLEALTGASLEVRIVTPFRLAWALWRYYHVPLPPRFARLAERLHSLPPGAPQVLSHAPEPVPSALPPVATRPERSSALARLAAALEDDDEDDEDDEADEPPAAAVRPAMTSRGRPEDHTVVVPPVPIVPTNLGPTPPPPSPAPPEAVASPDPPGTAPRAERPVAPVVERAEPGVAAQGRAEAGSELPTERPVRAGAGPVTQAKAPSPAGAEGRFAEARSRDEVVAALLDHALEGFEYVALFVVQGSTCEGLAARGPGADTQAVRGIAVPLEPASGFRTVKEQGAPALVKVQRAGTDVFVREDLCRPVVQEALIVPVHIGGRVALILWADAGVKAPTNAASQALGRRVEEATRAFERLILERKRRGGASQSPSGLAPASAVPASVGPPSAGPGPVAPKAEASRPQGPRGRAARGAEALEQLVRGAAKESAAKTVVVSPPSPPSAPTARPTPPPVSLSGPPPSTPLGGSPPQRERVASAVDEAERLVVEAMASGQLSDADAASLLGHGERALTAVFRHFPGPHSLDRAQAYAKLPVLAEKGPLLRLVTMFRHAAVPHLLRALEGPEPDARFCAMLCLGEVVHPSALHALVARLFDPDYPTRMTAIEVLKAYQRFPEFEAVGRTLRALLREAGSPAEHRRVAAHALGELRDAEAVAPLIATLGEPDAALGAAAHRALVVVTRQDFGTDPLAWGDWWKRAGAQHRIEWLIEALLHPESAIRHEASEELKKVTGQFFGYYFNLPRRERERAHQRYSEWWVREGARRFVQPRGSRE